MRCQVVLLRGYEGTDTPLSPPSHPDARRFFYAASIAARVVVSANKIEA